MGASEHAQRGLRILAAGRRHLDRPALADAQGSWTYAELLDRSALAAHRLVRTPGWERGCRVGMFLPRRKESAAVLLAVLRAGGIAVPFSVRAAARELAHEIADAGVTRIVADAGFGELLADVRGSGLTELPHVVDPGWLCADADDRWDEPEPGDDEPALMVYTSGTTGLPKGVVHTHGSLFAQVDVLAHAWEWTAADRLLHVLPLHHVHGLVNGLLGAIRAGAQLEFLDRFDPSDVWNRFAERRASVFYAVPTIYHQLVEAWDAADPATRRRWAEGAAALRLTVSGSAALPTSLWNRWHAISGQALLERYGMTEIGMALSNPYRAERRAGTVGQPLPGVHIRLVTETGEDAGEGVPGEIWIQSPTLFREYWNKPAATEASFRDGYFLTGDVAEWDHGYLRIRGRASVDILKSGGYKLSALEIEEALREHPAIREVAVVGVPDEEWGEIVAACVVLHPDQCLTLEMLRNWCRDKLASYKLPRRLDVRTELPRNAMGKVMKPDLVRNLKVNA
ncbi:MAG: acyl-CoA synthetase [Pirellulaceae bacterium]